MKLQCVTCTGERVMVAVAMHGWRTWGCTACTLNKLYSWGNLTQVESCETYTATRRWPT